MTRKGPKFFRHRGSEPDLARSFERAVRHHRRGELAEAERDYRRILDVAPLHPEVMHMLGVAIHQLRKDPEGPILLRAAITLQPNSPQMYSNLGNMLAERGEHAEAAAACQRAIALRPDFAEAYNNLGTALKGQGNRNAAVASYAKAVELDPAYRPAWDNLAVTLHEMGRFEQALAAHERVIAMHPNDASGYANLAVTLHAMERFAAAEAACAKALALRPRDARTLNNRALSLQELDRVEDALDCFRAAVELDPAWATAHYNFSLALLSAGRLEEGWAEYEWRWQERDFPSPPRHRDKPSWDGGALDGRTLLLHAEQGLGDTIQFVRYVPLVAGRAGRIVLECAPPLARLLTRVPGVDAITFVDRNPPPFDVQLPLLSLPRVLGTTLNNIPAAIPYLEPLEADVSDWHRRLAAVEAPRIGIAWAGSATHRRDRSRSLPREELLRLLDHRGVRWVSLQVGERRADLRGTASGAVLDPADDLRDFADTAALMANLDLIISVDTAAVHLAGALGRPTWLLQPFVGDWRWLRERVDSPWYPTLRIFRQPVRGDWRSVIDRVVRALEQQFHQAD